MVSKNRCIIIYILYSCMYKQTHTHAHMHSNNDYLSDAVLPIIQLFPCCRSSVNVNNWEYDWLI